MSCQDITELTARLRRFTAVRVWEQFHSPKYIAMALSIEVAEIIEHFQWLTQQQSRSLIQPERENVDLELADALIYLVRLADKLDVDLIAAANRKMAINEDKYPVEQVRGSAKKYTEYE